MPDPTCGGCDEPAHEPNDDCWWEDYGTCPYFARYFHLPGFDPEGVCAFGCTDEPECVTCQPSEGWPYEIALRGSSPEPA